LWKSPLLDRLIRGRAWIGVVAFALIGIVAMQLALLKFNAGIGRALEHEALLQTENATLGIENSASSAGDSIESQAAIHGMVSVPSGGLHFLSADGPADIRRAAMALSTPVGASAGLTAGNGATSSAVGSQSGENAASSTAGASGVGDEAPASSSSGSSGAVPATVTPSSSGSSGVTSETSGPSSTGTTGAGPGTTGAPTAPASGATTTGASPESGAPGGGTQAGPEG